jgi:hypothetical protein
MGILLPTIIRGRIGTIKGTIRGYLTAMGHLKTAATAADIMVAGIMKTHIMTIERKQPL